MTTSSSRAPDVQVDFFIVPHGYQVNVKIDGDDALFFSRDHVASLDEDKQKYIAASLVENMLERFRNLVRLEAIKIEGDRLEKAFSSIDSEQGEDNE